MFCRAKICVLLMTAGAITASAASLDVKEKNPAFSTDQQSELRIIKPAKAKTKLGTASRWKGVKVQKISPTARSQNGVEVNGFIFSKPADVPRPSTPKVSVAAEKK